MTATRTCAAVLLLALAAGARDIAAPNGAWTMTVPDSWTALPMDVLDSMPRSIHAAWQGPEEEDKWRDGVMVSVIEQSLQVSVAGREEFRAKLQAEVTRDPRVQGGVERVEVVRLGDRDAYRVDGFLIAQGAPALKNVKWYVPAGDKVYMFAFSAPASTFAYKLPAFETMAGSIRMKEAAPAPPGKEGDWRGAVAIVGVSLAVLCVVAIFIVARRTFRAATES